MAPTLLRCDDGDPCSAVVAQRRGKQQQSGQFVVGAVLRIAVQRMHDRGVAADNRFQRTCLVLAVFEVPLLVLAQLDAEPTGELAATGFFILGAGPILWAIGTATLRQTVTPAELLARVSAVHLLAYGSRPLGAALAAGVVAFGAMASLGLPGLSGFVAEVHIFIGTFRAYPVVGALAVLTAASTATTPT